MDNRIKVTIALVLACVLHSAQSEITMLTATAGQNVTLETGITEPLNYSDILWSRGSDKHVLINFSDKRFHRQESPRFQLNRHTGSLTIASVSINDSGLYEGQLFNAKQWTFDFNLTVVEAKDTTLPSGSSQKNPNQRSHAAVLGPVCLLLLCIVTTCTMSICGRGKRKQSNRQREIKAKSRGNSEVPV